MRELERNFLKGHFARSREQERVIGLLEQFRDQLSEVGAVSFSVVRCWHTHLAVIIGGQAVVLRLMEEREKRLLPVELEWIQRCQHYMEVCS